MILRAKIVSKWQSEAIAIPDAHWDRLSRTYEEDEAEKEDKSFSTKLQGIIDPTVFKTVRHGCANFRPC